MNYATAWAALLGYGSLREGDRVLIHAAAGGVGIAATQIARRHGAEVWGTSSPGKHDAIRGQGVQHPLDYTRDGWWSSVPPLDIVLDAIGGPSFKRSMGMLRAGGRVIGYGASSVSQGERKNMLKVLPKALPMLRGFNLIDQMQESKGFIGLNMLTLWKDRGTLAPWIDPITALIADGTVVPVVHEAVPFDRAGDAHRILGERRNVGKVVLVPAHGNSLRALVKHLDGISDEDIAGLNIPTGMPLVYELDDDFMPTKPGEYLDPEAAAAAAAAVANQGR